MSKEYEFDSVSVGMDGEGFFVRESGYPVPVVGLLGGEKGKPLECEGGGYLEDCVAWEINPVPVTVEQGRDHFIENVVKCLDAVRRKASSLDLQVDISPVKLFKKKDLLSEQASVSGCSDSFCCWDLKQLDKIDLSVTNHRFASGDIHVGVPWIEEYGVYARVNVARMLDIMFGLTEVLHCTKNKRIEFYGKSGIHRPTSYGVEHKTSSNYWMVNEETIGWAFDTAVAAVEGTKRMMDSSGFDRAHVGLDYLRHPAMEARNTWNRKLAHDVLNNLRYLPFPATK